MIEKLPGSSGYRSFAYDVALLEEFVREPDSRDAAGATGSHGGRRRSRIGGSLRGGSLRGGSLRGSFRKIRKKNDNGSRGLDSSTHSLGSLRGRKGISFNISGAGNLEESKASEAKTSNLSR